MRRTRSRRGRLSVRKTRSRRVRRSVKTQKKQRSQRGGNFISDTLGIPKGAYITKANVEDEYDSAPVLIQKVDEDDVKVGADLNNNLDVNVKTNNNIGKMNNMNVKMNNIVKTNIGKTNIGKTNIGKTNMNIKLPNSSNITEEA